MLFHRDIDIAAPAARVWAVYSDIEGWPRWTASVTSVTALDPGPLRVGSRARINQPKLPTTVWTITAIDEGRSWTWVAGGPGARSTATHTVLPLESGGSRVVLELAVRGPLGWLVGTLTTGLTNRYLAMEAAGLKATAEAGDGGNRVD
ncbi:SRPBCC family protein [Actinokineospora auranticolor]|uniref:Polyketide cyclase/dehydrase/lipid transport protein n=1 Tax=Actinokineospora auranticolor TaxID=155976 RepID=A0A2S6GFM3_9PSEU|nr:SRPBCC family protein [Actinokineospora auranticolor]PPK64012.1 polyketide cyclase/dehydrase/lipid transport protein [Actinokineospora auranticolor]